MVLPRLGGTPAVWNTCVVFFQAALLAGYGYVHLVSRSRRHPLLHLLLLLAPLAVLPLAVPEEWVPDDAHPALAVLSILTTRIGLPFFVLATTGPLLQGWFARTGEKDPYYLYAASNAGSVLGLLAYPLVLEPFMPLARQSALWSRGYGVLMGGIA
ncbi:MAG TPA: hypothetical protein VFF73_16640, partial [Planctomycetota bacterium]|nr:hypothetical protein [Planctomycetota bacterium]